MWYKSRVVSRKSGSPDEKSGQEDFQPDDSSDQLNDSSDQPNDSSDQTIPQQYTRQLQQNNFLFHFTPTPTVARSTQSPNNEYKIIFKINWVSFTSISLLVSSSISPWEDDCDSRKLICSGCWWSCPRDPVRLVCQMCRDVFVDMVVCGSFFCALRCFPCELQTAHLTLTVNSSIVGKEKFRLKPVIEAWWCGITPKGLSKETIKNPTLGPGLFIL